MSSMNRFQKVKNYYNWGGRFLNDAYHINAKKLDDMEKAKMPYRYDVINFLLGSMRRETTYLEIGVRNPNDNYNKIISNSKFSVDPGLEFEENPVDFAMTSDDFFEKLNQGAILTKEIRFDVIFIDGLHLADQAFRDIKNALEFVKDDGFIVLHDCNPPTEWHARETHDYTISPAMHNWNGTTWKAFVKMRCLLPETTACIDCDWGVGVISKTRAFNGKAFEMDHFYEYSSFDSKRSTVLNLLSFEEFKSFF